MFPNKNSRSINYILLFSILLLGCHSIRKAFYSFSFLYFFELLLFVLLLSECICWLNPKVPLTSVLKKCRAVNHYAWLIALLFFATFGLMVYAMYISLTFEWYDFGMIHQAIWNSSKGRLLEITNAGVMINNNWPNVSMLSGHVEWILLLFSPLYMAFSNPVLLLLLKISFLAASIIIVDMIAKEFVTKNERFIVTIIYAMFTPLHFIALKDFNADPFAIPFIFGAYLAYIKKRKKTFWLLLFFSITCKEYAAIALIAMGFILLLRFKDKKHGIACIATGIIYFSTCYFLINPLFNPDKGTTMLSIHFSQIGGDRGFSGIAAFVWNNPLHIIKKVLSNCDDLFYTLLPLLFVPFLDIPTVCAMILLLPKDLQTEMDISSHRLSLIVPFLFLGFLHFLIKCDVEKRKKIVVSCLLASFITVFFYGPTPFGHRFWREIYKYMPDQKDLTAKQFINRIPDDVPISVTPSFTPHLGRREILYLAPETGNGNKNINKIAEFVLIDTADEAFSWKTAGHPGADSLLFLIRAQGYSLKEQLTGIYLFSRNAK